MPNPPKVVPISDDERQVIARDSKARRVIIGIGAKRIALDLFTSITHLPPHTGDQPTAVPPMKSSGGDQPDFPVQASVQTSRESSPRFAQIPLDSPGHVRDEWTRPNGRGEILMPVLTIDPDNHIARCSAKDNGPSKAGAVRFASEKELATLVADWPGTRLIEIWNKLPGAKRVGKFTDRETAVRRIWKAVQELPAAHLSTKTERILALLKQPSGATLKALMVLTGWQPHSVRGFLSQVSKKRGLQIKSFDRNGERVYRIRS